MSEHSEAHAKHSLGRGWENLAERERRVVEAVLHRRPVVRDMSQAFADDRSFGQRMADRIATFGGSWPFIGLFMLFLAGWMALNSVLLARRGAFDPYPYILLNLILSTLAALQAPVIMMSQNRQGERDRLNAANDYEVNLKAELEIRALHEKLDALREADWAELVRLQQVQIQMLERLMADAEAGGIRESRPLRERLKPPPRRYNLRKASQVVKNLPHQAHRPDTRRRRRDRAGVQGARSGSSRLDLRAE